jgi:hypothetical protein
MFDQSLEAERTRLWGEAHPGRVQHPRRFAPEYRDRDHVIAREIV